MNRVQGIFIDQDNRVGVGLRSGITLFAFSPNEMRALADALQQAAEEIEACAAGVADAAIERAGRLQ